jgi:hypothetical protein
MAQNEYASAPSRHGRAPPSARSTSSTSPSSGNWAAAARSLGLHRSNLHHLAARLGLR